VNFISNDSHQKYLELRAAGRALHSKIAEARDRHTFNPVRVARSMTLPCVGQTLIFGEELEMAAFCDFCNHEFQFEGKSAVERFSPGPDELTTLQSDVLNGLRSSRTSLFQVTGVNSSAHQIKLHDLLDSSKEDLFLTDMQFAACLQRVFVPPLIFTRVVTVSDITMTGGFFFPFEPANGPGLLQAYRQKMKKVLPPELARERFVFFYKKFRQIGLPGAVDDAWTTSQRAA
jgi:hypothetical protein